MSQPARKQATYADIEALPAHVVGEIIRGTLQVHPRPRPLHGRTADNVLEEIRSPFDKGRRGPGGWWILSEPELRISGQLAVPDIAGWRRERMPALPATAYYTLSPDWVCEVLSPSTETLDRGEKMEVYAELDVKHVWLVDPDARTLEVYVNDQRGMRQLGPKYAERDLVRAPPFDAVELDLSAWWG